MPSSVAPPPCDPWHSPAASTHKTEEAQEGEGGGETERETERDKERQRYS